MVPVSDMLGACAVSAVDGPPKWLLEYVEWRANRIKLSENDGMWPGDTTPGEWADSDDAAVEMLDWVVAMVTCNNVVYGSCVSIEQGVEPDMRGGEVCPLCT